MNVSVTKAINGDITEFTKLYGEIYKKIYCVAYYSLANSKEAVDAVTNAARYAYENAESCGSEDELRELILKKTCEQIVARFRDYRKTAPSYEQYPSYIKAQLTRLTDAERLSVTMWAVFGCDADKISSLTGLALDIVTKKLQSGQTKLSAKL